MFFFFFLICSMWAETGKYKKEDIQTYLNGLRTMKATFTQTNPKGSKVRGMLLMKRPDKMRLTYEAPQKIITKNDVLYFYDLTDNSCTTYSTSSTPAGFILQNKILFNKEIYITELIETPSEVHAKLSTNSDGSGGHIKLTFTTEPFLKLNRWVVVENGSETIVEFDQDSLVIGIPIDDSEFIHKP